MTYFKKFERTMANFLLFISSLCIGLIQLISMVYFKQSFFFTAISLCCAFTSIWNHGTTNIIAKFVDRIYMVVYIAANSVIIHTIVEPNISKLLMFMIMISGILSVLLAMHIRSNLPKYKVLNSKVNAFNFANYFHLYSHIVVMVLHPWLSYYLSINCGDHLPVLCEDSWFYGILAS